MQKYYHVELWCFVFQVKTQEASVSSASLLVGVSWSPGLPPPPPPPLLSRDRLTTSAPCSQPSCSAPAPSPSPLTPVQTENAGNSGSGETFQLSDVCLSVDELMNDCNCFLIGTMCVGVTKAFVEAINWSVFSVAGVGLWFIASDEAFFSFFTKPLNSTNMKPDFKNQCFSVSLVQVW